jgi:ribosome-associated protein
VLRANHAIKPQPDHQYASGKSMKKIEYIIAPEHEYIELNHLLKHAGFADSGGTGGALVTTGVVKVDGQVELRKRNKIRAGQVVTIENTEIHVKKTA